VTARGTPGRNSRPRWQQDGQRSRRDMIIWAADVCRTGGRAEVGPPGCPARTGRRSKPRRWSEGCGRKSRSTSPTWKKIRVVEETPGSQSSRSPGTGAGARERRPAKGSRERVFATEVRIRCREPVPTAALTAGTGARCFPCRGSVLRSGRRSSPAPPAVGHSAARLSGERTQVDGRRGR